MSELNWVTKFRDSLPANQQAGYENRIKALAKQICDSDLNEAALIVETWKNLKFTDIKNSTFKSLEKFEAIAPKIKEVKTFLKKAGYITQCDHYDGTNLWVGKITNGESAYSGHSMRTCCQPAKNVTWIERCIFVEDDKITVGWGDGYHRSLSSHDRSITFDKLNELVSILELSDDKF